ncbi:MAG: hypothetical protein Q8M95_15640 [Candidatus Methanoperedens sp.]|nr:hypothetical protein [Candidatus Methanoperedens sp.]
MIVFKGYISVFIALFYLINSVYAQADLIVPDEKNTQNNSINANNLGNKSNDIRVALDHIFISNKNNSIEVSEIVVFRNEGQEYVFNKSTVYNTTSLSILVDKKSGVVMEVPYDAITLSGIEYNVVNFNDLRQGETVSIPMKIMKEPDYLFAGIGLFILFSTGLVYLFKGKIKNRGKKALTLEELELEKKKIFQTIYGFKKHAGSQESEEYRKLMEEYRNRAIQISYEIDNLKN